MRKKFSIVLALFLLLTATHSSANFDLSSMSFEELVNLRDQLNLAIWNSKDWQEVTVPVGVWEVGKDIPAGHWNISVLPDCITFIIYCEKLDEFGHDPDMNYKNWSEFLYYSSETGPNVDDKTEIDLIMDTGMYFINNASVIFTPYNGKPDLGFK